MHPIPVIAACIHATAAIALATVLAPGVSLAYGVTQSSYIRGHLDAWRGGWLVWIAAAASLLAFVIWWAGRLGWPVIARVAVVVASVGVLADVTAELRLIGWTAQTDVRGRSCRAGSSRTRATASPAACSPSPPVRCRSL